MKTLVLMRHGRAEAFTDGKSDLGRRLLKSGIAETLLIGKRLHDSGFSPDLIISSRAKRAHATAKLMASCLHYDSKRIVFDHRIFEALETDLLQVIKELPDEIFSVLVVGHNPSISMVGYRFHPVSALEFPTSAAMWVSFDAKSWRTIKESPSKFQFYFYPGNSSG